MLIGIYLQPLQDSENKCNTRIPEYVPDQYKSHELCIRTVEEDPCQLRDVPNHLCGDLILCVPDWFVTQELLKIWQDNVGYCNYDLVD